MAKIKRPYIKIKAKPGRKAKATRQSYPLHLKPKARAWKLVDGMRTTDKKKIVGRL